MSARKAGWERDSIGGWVHIETCARVWESCHEAHVGQWYWRTKTGERSGYAPTRSKAAAAAIDAARTHLTTERKEPTE